MGPLVLMSLRPCLLKWAWHRWRTLPNDLRPVKIRKTLQMKDNKNKHINCCDRYSFLCITNKDQRDIFVNHALMWRHILVVNETISSIFVTEAEGQNNTSSSRQKSYITYSLRKSYRMVRRKTIEGQLKHDEQNLIKKFPCVDNELYSFRNSACEFI